MVRALMVKRFDDDLDLVRFAGLSTDTKPTGGLVTGSEFVEVDTGDVYAYDETDGGTWAKIKAGPA